MSSPRPLPAELVDFVESGASLLLGTRDANMRPEMTRGCGAVVAPDRTKITFFIPAASGALAIANLRDNARLAVGVSRTLDSNTYQVKGHAIDIHEATESERPLVERYLGAFVEQLYMVGLPRSIIQRFRVWPAWSVTIAIDDIYLQTPGPEAGKRLEAR